MVPAHIQHSLLLLSDKETDGERKASSFDSTPFMTKGEETKAKAPGE